MNFASSSFYISFILSDARNIDTGSWYNYNDSRVSQISSSKISGTNAYILFYVKKEIDHF